MHQPSGNFRSPTGGAPLGAAAAVVEVVGFQPSASSCFCGSFDLLGLFSLIALGLVRDSERDRDRDLDRERRRRFVLRFRRERCREPFDEADSEEEEEDEDLDRELELDEPEDEDDEPDEEDRERFRFSFGGAASFFISTVSAGPPHSVPCSMRHARFAAVVVSNMISTGMLARWILISSKLLYFRNNSFTWSSVVVIGKLPTNRVAQFSLIAEVLVAGSMVKRLPQNSFFASFIHAFWACRSIFRPWK